MTPPIDALPDDARRADHAPANEARGGSDRVEPKPDPGAGRPGFARMVERRAADGAVEPAAIDEALAFVAARRGGDWVARTRPPGIDLVAGHPARGTVLELTGPDHPFIVTTVEEELRSRRVRVAQMSPISYGAIRNGSGALVDVEPARAAARPETLLQVELEQALDPGAASELLTVLLDLLGRIAVVTTDHSAMRERLTGAAIRLAGGHRSEPGVGIDAGDAVATVHWLLEGNAVLLGLSHRGPTGPERRSGSIDADLGLLRADPALASQLLDARPVRGGPDELLVVSRVGALSPLHRRVPMLLLELWTPAADDGEPVVERLIWVLARRAAGASLSSVPALRRKLDRLLEREDVIRGSYDEQHLTLLFQSLPEDDLFSLDLDDLHELVHELRGEDRDQSVRVVLRPSADTHSVAALVTVPVERWTRTLRERLERFLLAQLDGERADVALTIGGGSAVVTARFLVRVRDECDLPIDLDTIAREVRLLCRSWEEQLAAALRSDEEEPTPPSSVPLPSAASVAARWAGRLPEAYRDAVPATDARRDVVELEAMAAASPAAAVAVVGSVDVAAAGTIDGASVDVGSPHPDRVRVWFGRRRSPGAPERLGLVTDHLVELSSLLPALESLDLWVTDEARWAAGDDLHLHHLGVRVRARRPAAGRDESPDPPTLASTADGQRVAEAVVALVAGRADRDGLNRLVVHAGVGWADVAVLRAYRRYRHQIDARDESAYVDDVLVAHPEIARLLVAQWHARFDPSPSDSERRARAQEASEAAHRACDALGRLDHDRILRGLAGTIDATLRTNHTLAPDGPLALKFDPSLVPGAPRPRPHREVFVSGRRVEGVHLRGGPVARGGLRASDRVQDYRAEVLDLMATQVLKNAIIVPTGAKGGFVLRDDGRPTAPGEQSPGDRQARVAAAYDAFVGALLDVTDDIEGDAILAVPGRWDGDDPYLVVAADKGTAAFSDRANALAVERGFWLGDAFASGGSQGYDHKALGITARGAWVAIDRHLRALGLDAQRDEITVAGVGDMSGDVFGNGLLHSDRLRLVAAFDHRHVFLDPDPDPVASHVERQRLFDQPGSSWADYDGALLSSGGGVHPRSAKAIPLSREVRAALRVEAEEMTPADLVRAVLCAPVDLLYFGGIGTYVRSSVEEDAQVDDRANAEVRVVGRDVRARVVGEGANLALTQRARVEIARRGGRINVDAIDNAAGVDCSDHEVNLKILLALAEGDGRIDRGERDQLLAAHADDVVEAVLSDCRAQSEALDRAERAAPSALATVAIVLRRLVTDGVLDPDALALPDDSELAARAAAGGGFSRPELAVLLAGVKRRVAADLLDSDVPDEPVVRDALVGYFPAALAERFDDLLDQHRLRRELIASEVANDLVDHLGLTAVVTLADELDVGVADVALAYWAVRGILRAPSRWVALARRRGPTVPDLATDPVDAGDLLADVLREMTRRELQRRQVDQQRGGRWDAGARIAADRPVADAVATWLAADPDPDRRRRRARLAAGLVAGGLDPTVAEVAADVVELGNVAAVAEVGRDLGRDPVEVLTAFRAVADGLGLDELVRRTEAVAVDGAWADDARRGLLDDLEGVRSEAAARALAQAGPDVDPAAAVADLLAAHPTGVAHATGVRRRLAGEPTVVLEGLTVAVRAVREATRGGSGAASRPAPDGPSGDAAEGRH